jgi:hypothetical protein
MKVYPRVSLTERIRPRQITLHRTHTPDQKLSNHRSILVKIRELKSANSGQDDGSILFGYLIQV